MKKILFILLIGGVSSCSTEPVINNNVTINQYYGKKTGIDTILDFPEITDTIIKP